MHKRVVHSAIAMLSSPTRTRTSSSIIAQQHHKLYSTETEIASVATSTHDTDHPSIPSLLTSPSLPTGPYVPKRPFQSPLDYHDRMILAPMVRVGVLPFRLLALHHGAHMVYSEELVDRRLLQTVRTVNEELGVAEYRDRNNPSTLVYQACNTPPGTATVLQLGTANASLALQAAQHLYDDYDAVDVNCGCPVHFSVQGGMGAALLKAPPPWETLHDILTTLVRNLDKPVTCKVRLLDTVPQTVDLVRRVAQTGISAIALHARYIPQRPREPAHWDKLREVVDAVRGDVGIPLIANGDVFRHDDFDLLRQETGCSSIMVARGAIANPAIFAGDNRGDSASARAHMAQDIVDLSVRYGVHHNRTKYILQKMYETQQQLQKMSESRRRGREGISMTPPPPSSPLAAPTVVAARDLDEQAIYDGIIKSKSFEDMRRVLLLQQQQQ